MAFVSNLVEFATRDWKSAAISIGATIFVAQLSTAIIKSAFGLRRRLDVLETVVWGQGPNKQTVILIAGFTDTARVYENNVVKALAANYRVVGINHPGFTKATQDCIPLFGWNLSEQARLFYNTVQEVMKDDRSGKKPILVNGDINILAAAHPELFEKMVIIEVAPGNAIEVPPTKKWSVFGLLLGVEFSSMPFVSAVFFLAYTFMSYSSFLIGSYFFPYRPIANFMLRFFAWVMGAPSYVRDPKDREDDGGYYGVKYIHGYLHLNYFFPWVFPMRSSIPSNIPMLNPQVPCFFAYGKNKPVNFMSQTWIDLLSSRTAQDGSKAIGYHGGHWFYTDPKNPSTIAFLADLAAFLKP